MLCMFYFNQEIYKYKKTWRAASGRAQNSIQEESARGWKAAWSQRGGALSGLAC